MKKIVDVTPNQYRFLVMKEYKNSKNTVPLILKFTGQLDINILEKSLQHVIDRHESLRTKFKKVGLLEYKQIILKKFKFKLRVFKNTRNIDAFISKCLNKKFNSFKMPLFNIFLIRKDSKINILYGIFDHSIFDATSKSIFIEELAFVYNSLIKGIDPKIDDSLQPSFLKNEIIEIEIQKNLPFWRKKLEGRTSYPELFTDAPRTSEMTNESEHCFLDLPIDLVHKVKKLAVEEKITVFTIITAALNILISKYTDQDFVNIGLVSSGRKGLEGFNKSIGCFINNTVLSTEIVKDSTCRKFILDIKNNLNELLNHERIPFDRLVKELGIPLDRSRIPLFQILINGYPQSSIPTFEGLIVEKPIPLQESHFDFTLYVFRSPNGILLNLNYNRRLFTANRPIEFLNQLETVLMQIVTSPDRKLHEITLLTENFKNKLPDPMKPIDDYIDKSLLDLINESLKVNKEKIAIKDEPEQWSYFDLDNAICGCTNFLLGKGFRGWGTVAVYTGRNALLPISIISVLKAGFKFVILDPEYPAARLKDIFEISKPDYTLISEFTEGQYKHLEIDSPYCVLPHSKEEFFKKFNNYKTELFPVQDINRESYILFTSGSTGKPKAILNTLKPLSQFISWYHNKFDFTSADKFSMISGLSHDPLLRDIFTPLSCGASLIIPRNEIITKPEQLLEWILKKKITIMHLTPAHLQILLMNDNLQHKDFCLRRLFVGGDKLTNELVETLMEQIPNIKIINCYGATETPQIMTYCEVEKQYVTNIPIGKGRAGCDLLIMNEERLCGMGELGEIIIRSPYLSKGYIDDPENTTKKFVQNSFSTTDNDFCYKTGDIGRYLEDGSAECIGRNDDQVKINGVRIEPGEIDVSFRQHPNIANSCTITMGFGTEKRLVSFYTSKDSCDINSNALKNFLRSRIPAYMIPSVIVRIDSFPLNPNGKIDRKKLLTFDVTSKQGDNSANDGDIFFIRDIFRFLHKDQTVSAYDTFNTLGGDSLSFIQSSMYLEKYLGFIPENWENIPIKDLRKDNKLSGKIKFIEIIQLLRAISIVFIVIGHVMDSSILGGNVAILFIIAGYSFARFKGHSLIEGHWLKSIISYLRNILIPYWIVIIVFQLFKLKLNIPDLLLYTINIEEKNSTAIFMVFFIQVLTQSIILFSLFFAFKAIRKYANNNIWRFSIILLVLSIAVFLCGDILGASTRTPNYFFWLIALGWAIFYSNDLIKRIAISVVSLGVFAYVNLIGGRFYHCNPSNACIVAVILLWVKSIPFPLGLKKIIQYIAASTYFIYLTHWAFVRLLNKIFGIDIPFILVIVPLIVGIALQFAYEKAIMFYTNSRNNKSY